MIDFNEAKPQVASLDTQCGDIITEDVMIRILRQRGYLVLDPNEVKRLEVFADQLVKTAKTAEEERLRNAKG